MTNKRHKNVEIETRLGDKWSQNTYHVHCFQFATTH